MTILFINACVRADSRTKQLADYVLKKNGAAVKEVCLAQAKISPLDGAALEVRNRRAAADDFSDSMFDLAKDFAAAETIVIAAPYWDLSFPAALKSYIEAINVIGLTFAYNKAGQPYGLCRAKKLIYVTTAGGLILDDAYGFGYIKALAHNFYGIQDIFYFKAEGLDFVGADVKGILRAAERKIDLERDLLK